MVTDGGAIRYSSGSTVGLPAGTSTPKRARVVITDRTLAGPRAGVKALRGVRAGNAVLRAVPSARAEHGATGDGRLAPERGWMWDTPDLPCPSSRTRPASKAWWWVA